MKRINPASRITSLVSGSGLGYTLEHSIFNVFIFILIGFALVATVINFIIDMHFVVNMLSVVGAISMLGLFYHTRIAGVFKPYHVLILLFYSTTLLGIVYFFNAGIDGPISFMFVMMMIILIIVSPERLQAFIFLYLLAVLIGIHIYEYQFPENTVPYPTRSGRYIDVITALAYCMTFMALTIIAFKRSYNKERRNVESKNSELLRKNEQIKVLLKELNHRVKNNLQIVSGLLSLQARRTSDAVSISALNEGKDRLMSMALLHKKLYQDDNFNEVNVRDYISDLFRYLLDDLVQGEKRVKIIDDIHDISLTSQQAVSFGLIMNEIITNIRKHAFDGSKRQAEITVICLQQEGRLLLEVKDNGVGMKGSYPDKDRPSFGLELIDLLVTQLEGTWTIAGSEEGTFIQIRFPITAQDA